MITLPGVLILIRRSLRAEYVHIFQTLTVPQGLYYGAWIGFGFSILAQDVARLVCNTLYIDRRSMVYD